MIVEFVRVRMLLVSVTIAMSVGLIPQAIGQQFYFGADLSYVNEMNDCGVVYTVDSEPQEAYSIFAENNCGLVRLRAWHSPAWYDGLNDGRRYSDQADFEKSIARAKAVGMAVLLDFHLSDNWADPSKQVVPAAWDDVVDNLPVLKDSLYNYLKSTLEILNAKNLLPEMIQIGNETNRGILLSQEENDAGWVLDWERNAPLFNAGIKAVRDFEQEYGKEVKIVIHAADPDKADYIFGEFIDNGVTDFDIMGISYYWAWHKPTEISDAGEAIQNLRSKYSGYEVLIVETGYIWTWESNDDAGNIINEVHPDYRPPSPEVQKQWLIDMTQEVMNAGCMGVIYWEPAWVSSPCWTQWGRGSHQEHATFFDFDNNLLQNGGIGWMTHEYDTPTSILDAHMDPYKMTVRADSNSNTITIKIEPSPISSSLDIQIINAIGQSVLKMSGVDFMNSQFQLNIPDVPTGVYTVSVLSKRGVLASAQVLLSGN
jgi:arabinogalactan endo-1,4-beta-galactosidase